MNTDNIQEETPRETSNARELAMFKRFATSLWFAKACRSFGHNTLAQMDIHSLTMGSAPSSKRLLALGRERSEVLRSTKYQLTCGTFSWVSADRPPPAGGPLPSLSVNSLNEGIRLGPWPTGPDVQRIRSAALPRRSRHAFVAVHVS